jgi:hypothetical protein
VSGKDCGRDEQSRATASSVMQPVTLLGRRGQPAAEAAREFLDRNDAPLHWVDLDGDPLLPFLTGEAIESAGERPLALFADGSRLQAPSLFAEPTPGRLDPALREAYVPPATGGPHYVLTPRSPMAAARTGSRP